MSIIIPALIWLAIHLFVLGLGVVTGLLLRWVLPMELGQSVLIGVVASSVSVFFFARLMSMRLEAEDDSGDTVIISSSDATAMRDLLNLRRPRRTKRAPK